MPRAKYTAADYTRAITKALEARDVNAAYGLLLVMAHDHPREAHEIRQALLLGSALAGDG